jgi:hypothetical protein
MFGLQLAVLVGLSSLGLGCGLLISSPTELVPEDAAPAADAGPDARQRDGQSDGLGPEAMDPTCPPRWLCPADEPTSGASCEDSSALCEYRNGSGCFRLYACELRHLVQSPPPWPLSPSAMSCHAALDSWFCGRVQSSTLECECIQLVDAAQWVGLIDAAACQCPATLPVLGTRCTAAEERCSYSFGCGEPTVFCDHCGIWSYRPGSLIIC